VTGASAGIGKAFAHALAAEGADVVLLARRADRLASVAHELRRRYDVATEVLVADLSDREGVAEVERRLEDDRAPIDLLVNNAGGSEAGGRGPFLDVDRAVLEGQAMLNGLAVMLLTHAGLTAM
jgi:hypothetical protein